MRLSALLKDDVVLRDFRAADKWEAITRLVDHLVATQRIPADRRQALLDLILARERDQSTGLEHGVAIPHATVAVLEEAVAVVAVAPEGVPFQSADGQPARILVLYFIPRKHVQKYIRMVAGIAKLLSHPELRDGIRNAPSTAEIIAIIRREEEKEQASLGGAPPAPPCP
jgi:mannitol/fructose-specific phosphotransferase system IIA component (Ntr-type)